MVLPLVGSNIIYCLLEYGLLLKIFKPICFHNDWDVVIGHLNHIDLYGIPAQSIERASSVRGSRRRHTAERAIDITDIPASFFRGSRSPLRARNQFVISPRITSISRAGRILQPNA